MEVLPEEFVVGPARPPRIVLLNPEVIPTTDQQRLPHSDGLPGPPRRLHPQVLAFPWLPSHVRLGSHDPHASNHRQQPPPGPDPLLEQVIPTPARPDRPPLPPRRLRSQVLDPHASNHASNHRQARIPFLSRLSLLRHGQTGRHFPHVGFVHRFWTPTPPRPPPPPATTTPPPPPGALAATTTPPPATTTPPRHRAPWPPRPPPPPPGALAATTTPPATGRPGRHDHTTPATGRPGRHDHTTPATGRPGRHDHTTPATTTPPATGHPGRHDHTTPATTTPATTTPDHF
ncbi:formin-like protein 5 [Oreochromis niloticus]|uniref:formin-like protein 5 n=1 Tax=Oreochromis niloticus TaxID=8128 RepID=UPI0009054D0A|nr:formin-like protein 5 [Oreochromis niloticus]